MIELDRHIEILLLSNDCVIVPGLGGFMAHYVDARYDETDHSFLPPLRSIGFNPKLTLNDSLLAQSYVEAYDISYPEAVTRIDDEVRELKQHLEHSGNYDFNDLGELRLNADGNLEFEPCEAGILTPELYGLADFEMKSLADLKKAREVPTMKVSTAPVMPLQAQSTPLQGEQVSSEDDEEPKTISVRVSWVRNLAVACLAILAFFLFPSPLHNDSISPMQSSIDTHLLMRILPKNVTKGEASVKKAVEKASLQSAPKAAEQPKTVVKKDEPAYTLVLASRITKRNANAYVEQLHRQGYEEAQVYVGRHDVKVVFGSYTTKSDALDKLNQLNDNKQFTGAWILKYPSAK